jgi:hypothetical protein
MSALNDGKAEVGDAMAWKKTGVKDWEEDEEERRHGTSQVDAACAARTTTPTTTPRPP